VFSEQEIYWIRRTIQDNPSFLRAPLSRLFCQKIGWYKPDGGLKEMSCRVAMLRMHQDGLIQLPPPQRECPNKKRRILPSHKTDPQPPLNQPVQTLPPLSLQQVTGKDSALYNEYIHRYHYLGYQPLPGAQIRYIAKSNDNIVALMGFGAAAWKTAPRDRFIGWTKEQRQNNLHLITNNARFLILPWIKSPNLASKLLAMAVKQLPEDWHKRYGYRPVMLETFVESPRFLGTCYKAANWIWDGENWTKNTRRTCPGKISGSTPSQKSSNISYALDRLRHGFT
jgi:hypothetical protein